MASVRAPDPLRQLIHDPQTGLALFGFDPVAFHSEGRALQGKERFQIEASGFVWRFMTAANRAAFLQSPEDYVPHFGGHDAMGVAEGRMAPGDPRIFLIFGDRAAFFRSADDRAAFAADEAVRKRAIANWPDVVRQFAGH